MSAAYIRNAQRKVENLERSLLAAKAERDRRIRESDLSGRELVAATGLTKGRISQIRKG